MMDHSRKQYSSRTALARLREQLLGDCFTGKHDLRHRAEVAGFLFVPVEQVEGGDQDVVMALRPKGIPEVRVHARRSQPWHPFFITAVEFAES